MKNMGIQLIENDLFNDDDDSLCSTCFSFSTNSSASSTQKQQMLNSTFKTHQQSEHYQHQQQKQPKKHQFSKQTHNLLPSKDLVGNSKEFRIENNKYNLRIIGNGNRIRIALNSGNIQIIGNSSRLRITKNSGIIKYTGNEGRICLGSESTQQIVDYIGCNGLLKVVNSTEFNKSPKCCENNNRARKTTDISPIISDELNNNKNKRTSLPGNATKGTSPNLAPSSSSPLNARVKSASFDELIDMKHESWQHFNNFLQHNGFQHFTKVSLPNLDTNINESSANLRLCDCKCKRNTNKSFINNMNESKNSCIINRINTNGNSKGINISSHRNIVNNCGDIVINNSVNISIA